MLLSMKSRLTVMSFLQFFIWGAWLLTVANYWFGTKHWDNTEFAAIFSTMGIASVFMPTLCGIIADRWMNAEKLYGILHVLGGLVLLFLPQVNDSNTFFWVIFLSDFTSFLQELKATKTRSISKFGTEILMR